MSAGSTVVKCREQIPGERVCGSKATLKVPTGYGRDDWMCGRHGAIWASSHRRWFERLVAFYAARSDGERESA